jgi:hypothetical protein
MWSLPTRAITPRTDADGQCPAARHQLHDQATRPTHGRARWPASGDSWSAPAGDRIRGKAQARAARSRRSPSASSRPASQLTPSRSAGAAWRRSRRLAGRSRDGRFPPDCAAMQDRGTRSRVSDVGAAQGAPPLKPGCPAARQRRVSALPACHAEGVRPGRESDEIVVSEHEG